MAKLSMIKKNEQRIELSKKWGPKRAELRKAAVDMRLSEEDRGAARLKLQKMPRNTAPSRVDLVRSTESFFFLGWLSENSPIKVFFQV
jgi:hypothetical protein